MKIFNPIGSKERLIEIFQGVNKVKLNEAFGQGLNPSVVLEDSFNQLKNGGLTIKHTNTQSNDNESFVELTCVDRQGNNVTFVFKANVAEADQDGVFNVQGVALESFSFDSVQDEESVEMSGDTLKQFNLQHQNELYQVVDEYINVEEPSEELAEAIRLIDAIKKQSYPYGGSPDDMQTGKGYADEKPTNPKVRVKAPELDKFVSEREELSAPELYGDAPENDDDEDPLDMQGHLLKRAKEKNPNFNWDNWDEDDAESGRGRMGEDLNSILHTPGTAGAAPLYPQAAELGVTNQYMLRTFLWKDIGVELLDIQPEGGDKFKLIFRFEGKVYGAVINKNYGSVQKVISLIKKKLNNLNEFDKPAMKLIMQAPGGATAGGVKQLEEKMKLPIVGVSSIGGVQEENSPVNNLSPEKKLIIKDAINNLTVKKGRPEYAPTAQEVNAEIKRMKTAVGESQDWERGNDDDDGTMSPDFDKLASDYDEYGDPVDVEDNFDDNDVQQEPEDDNEPVEELSPEKKAIILQAYDNLVKGGNVSPTYPEIKREIDRLEGKTVQKTRSVSPDVEDWLNEEDTNVSDYPKPLGKKFKPKKHYPKKKQKIDTTVKISEEVYDDDDISGLPEVPSGYGAKKYARKDMGRGSEEIPYKTDFTPEPETGVGLGQKKIVEPGQGSSNSSLADPYPYTSPLHEEAGGTDDPTKEEMVDFLTKKFQGLLDPQEIDANNFDMEAAIYWFANHYHGGQWTNLYSVLSTSDYKPGPMHRDIKDDESETATMMYDALVDKYGGGQEEMVDAGNTQWRGIEMNEGKFQISPELQQFYDANDGQINDDWEEYISRLRDSMEHKTYLQSCDDCFWEWIEENYWDDATQSYVYNYPANVMDEGDDKWIQKAVDPAHKGYCTPMTKDTCTPRRKALAKRFKKGIDEEKGEDIEQVEIEKDEVGDEIKGGKADKKKPKDFDKEQLAMGLKVEMEHTDDPMIAIEIAMDHLTEFPDYYTRLDKMEKQAKGDTKSEGAEGDDKELTDMLLGYKSHNVGDEIDEGEEVNGLPKELQAEILNLISDIETNYETRDSGEIADALYVDYGYKFKNVDYNTLLKFIREIQSKEKQAGIESGDYVMGGRNLDAPEDTGIGERPQFNQHGEFTGLYEGKKEIITEEQIKMARQALNKRGLSEGMTKKEAVQILIKHNIR